MIDRDQRTPFSTRQLILATSFVMSIYLTLVYYPGVLYSDSYVRWDLAQTLLSGTTQETYMSVMPSIWMRLTYDLTNNYAAFTLLQSFLFFYSSLHLIAKLGTFETRAFLLPLVLFVSFPLFQGYSVFHEPSVGTCIGLNFLLLLTVAQRREQKGYRKTIHYAALLLAAITIFGFRQNSITLFPALALLLYRERSTMLSFVIGSAVLLLASLSVQALPEALGIQRRDTAAIGFAWETVQVLKSLHAPEYEHYLDYAGNTRGSMGGVEESMWVGSFMRQGFTLESLTSPENGPRIKKDYVSLALAEPAAFIRNKLDVWKRVMGISQPLHFYEFDENRFGMLEKFGYRETPLRHTQFEVVERVMEALAPARRPIVMFGMGLVLWVLGRYWLDETFLGWLLLLAAFYYVAFLVTTQSYEFRYFFVSFYLLSTMALVILCRMLSGLLAWCGARLRIRDLRTSPKSSESTADDTRRVPMVLKRSRRRSGALGLVGISAQDRRQPKAFC